MAISAFAFLAHYLDAFIYVFKALIRATKALGRNFFNIKFEEDVEKHSATQTMLDLIALLCFIATIVLLTACANPLAPTIAWIVAWVGLGLVGISDYYLPRNHAKEELHTQLSDLITAINNFKNSKLQDNTENAEDQVKNQMTAFFNKHKSYELINKSFKLYGMLMLGIGALLICGSAAAVTTGAAFIVLNLIAKLASAYLVCIAIFRFLNYVKSKLHKPSKEASSIIELINQDKSADVIIQEIAENEQIKLDLSFFNSSSGSKSATANNVGLKLG